MAPTWTEHIICVCGKWNMKLLQQICTLLWEYLSNFVNNWNVVHCICCQSCHCILGLNLLYLFSLFVGNTLQSGFSADCEMDAISGLEINLGTSFCSSAALLLALVAMPCVWRTISNLIINLIKCLSAISIQNKLPTATEAEQEGGRGKEGRYKYPSQKKTTINTHVCVSLRVCVIQPAVLGALTNDVNAAQAQLCLVYPPKKRTCWESTFH